ncbi:hypothetical protein [Pseudomonas putida]|uniref:Uncharacterized protein n=1 Tax=Pseudomonas putida TaxID=303 RepID=A0A6I6XI26_PSEPU|nr:hypothetical protein [Pseudomonas putida]QHG65214.1 hypothetical protein C2H86_12675 [Pseudomonas putida]
MEKTQFNDSGSSMTQVNETDTGEPRPSRALQDGAAYELPLCPNRMVIAVEAVRGPGFALALLREHLHLRASAQILFSSYSNCYFLLVDDFDRFQNVRVGKLEAVSTMPFRSSEIFKNEISSWTPSDIARVVDVEGIKALNELGLISPAP